MKVKPIHIIPFYGEIVYLREYFSADKRDAIEAKQALKMYYYHVIASCVLVILIAKIVILLIKS